MADTTLRADLVVDVSMGMLRGDSQVRGAVESLFDNAVGVGLVRGTKRSSRELEREMMKVIAASMRQGAKPAAQELYRSFKRGSQELVSAREQLARLDRQIIQEQDQASRKILQEQRKAIDEEIRKKTQLMRKTAESQAKETQRLADVFKQAKEDLSESLEDGLGSLNQLGSDATGQDFGDSAEKARKTRSAMQRGGKGLGRLGKGMQGASKGMGGIAGKGMAMMGRGVAAIGAMGVAAAGVAAAVVAVGAALYKVYDWSKGMNKAMLDNVATADLWVNASSKGRVEMNRMTSTLRDAATDMAFDWRMTAEETIGMIRAINDAGLTFKELSDFAAGYSFRDAVQETAEMVLVASKSLGISYEEAGGYAARMHADFGQGLEEVRMSFSKIFAAASSSGMAVKDFFSAINEASSGMALYNFRLDDTLGLLNMMTDVLGEDLAKQQLKVEGQFRNMGMQERTKTVLTTGTGRTRGIMSADARAQAEEFTRNFAPSLQRLAGTGVLTGGGMLDEQALGRMGEVAFGDLVGQLRDTGDPNSVAMARSMENIRQLARGADGGALGMASGLGGLSKAGELAMQLSQASSILGTKGISSMEGMDRMAFEEITGMQGDNFEMMQRLDRELRYEFRKQGGEAGTGQSFGEFVASGGFTESFEKAALDAQDPMRRLAAAQIKETTSVVQTLKNVVTVAIDNVAGWMDSIYRFWTRDEDDEQIRNVQESQDKIEDLQAQLANMSELQSASRTEHSTATGGERDTLEARMVEREELMAQLRQQIDSERDMMSELSAGKTREEAQQRVDYRATTRAMGEDPMTWVQSLFDEGKMNEGIRVAQAAGVLDNLSFDAGEMTSQQWVNSPLWDTMPDRNHTTRSMTNMRLDSLAQHGGLSDHFMSDVYDSGALDITLAEGNTLAADQLSAIQKQHTAIEGELKTEGEKQKVRDDERDRLLTELRREIGREGMAALGARTGLSQHQLGDQLRGGLDSNEQMSTVRAAQRRYRELHGAAPATGELPPDWQEVLIQYGVSASNARSTFSDFVWSKRGGFRSFDPQDKDVSHLFAKPGGAVAQALGGQAGAGAVFNISINGTEEMNARMGQILDQSLVAAGISRRPGPSKFT